MLWLTFILFSVYGLSMRIKNILKEMAGKKFGYWTVIARSKTRFRSTFWLCKCKCGTIKNVSGYQLRYGKTKSCGCKVITHGHTSNGVRSCEYETWTQMRRRCLNPHHKDFSRYGGRGITICPRWIKSFAAFYNDMGPKPNRYYSINRIDNDGPYNRENCEWATVKKQASNRASSRFITHNGRTLTVSEWSDELGIPAKRIFQRIYQGCTPHEALTLPRHFHRY